MDRQEAIQTLSKVGKISVSHSEDLYDSFFPKPVVPQYVADWYEEHKDNFDYELWDYLVNWDFYEGNDFKEWIRKDENQPIITLVSMHQFSYEVKKEPRYTVKIKGIPGYVGYLNQNSKNQEWFFASNEEFKSFRVAHTRKELEANGFDWVFSCEGVEVKEVE